MPRPKLTIPEDLDMCANVLFRVPIKLIPAVGGLLELLEWKASWIPEDQEQGEQIALELERRLIMSECENPIADQIAELVACLCALASGIAAGTPTTYPPANTSFPDYDAVPSVVYEDVGDPPHYATWDEWREYKCMAAQWIADRALKTVELAQSLILTWGNLAFATFSVGLIALGVTLPMGVLLAIIQAIAAGTALIVYDLQKAWLSTHWGDIVCAIYSAPNVIQARANLQQLIAVEWSPALGSSILVEIILYNTMLNLAFDVDLKDSDLLPYDPDLCDTCTPPVIGVLCDNPVTPARYSGTFLTWGSTMVMGYGPGWPDCPLGTQTFVGPEFENTLTGMYLIHGELWARSGFGPAATVGYCSLEGYHTGTLTWNVIGPLTFTTTEAAMVLTHIEYTDPAGVDLTNYSMFRVGGNNQPASCKDDPGPGYQLEGFCFTLEEIV